MPTYSTLFGKRDLADVVMGFEWGDGSGVLGRLNQITRVLAKVREEGHRRCESRSWSWSGSAITQATLEVRVKRRAWILLGNLPRVCSSMGIFLSSH